MIEGLYIIAVFLYIAVSAWSVIILFELKKIKNILERE